MDARPVHWNTDYNAHLLIAGSTGSGKSNLSRHLVNEVSPHATIYLMDTGKLLHDYWDQIKSVDGFAKDVHMVERTLSFLNSVLTQRLELNEVKHKPIFIFFEHVPEAVQDERFENSENILPLLERLLIHGDRASIHVVMVGQSLTARYNLLVDKSAHVLMGQANRRYRDRYAPGAPELSRDVQRGTGVFWDRRNSVIIHTSFVHQTA